MITVCVLNYHRPYFLAQLFLPVISHYKSVDEIIISHGREEAVFDYESDACRVVHRHDYGDTDERFGLARRWLCWEQARNEVILSMDEDIFLPEHSLDAMYEQYRRDPDVIHTVYGRRLSAKLRYHSIDTYGRVPIAGTGCMLFKRDLGRACLDRMQLVDDFVRDNSNPLWNGEDIFASMVSISACGRLNQSHHLPVRDLEIWGKPGIARIFTGHLEYRSRIVAHTADKLELREKLHETGSRHSEFAHRTRRIARGAWRRSTGMAKWWRTKAHISPKFYVVGADVEDTSALFSRLAQHPDVLPPSREIHGYHVTRYDMGEHSYVRHKEPAYHNAFPLHRPWGRRLMTGEHCASYFYMPEACHRMCINLPQVDVGWRCVVVLRDPVERAFWRFMRRRALANSAGDSMDDRFRTWRCLKQSAKGNVMEDPDQADKDAMEQLRYAPEFPNFSSDGESGLDVAFNATMEKELWCLENGLAPLLSGMAVAQLRQFSFCEGSEAFKFDDYHACVGGGVYAYWLDYMLRRLDINKVMVVFADQMYTDFDAVFARVCEFLELDSDAMASRTPPRRPVPPPAAPNTIVSPATRARWTAYFDEHNRAAIARSKNKEWLEGWAASSRAGARYFDRRMTAG